MICRNTRWHDVSVSHVPLQHGTFGERSPCFRGTWLTETTCLYKQHVVLAIFLAQFFYAHLKYILMQYACMYCTFSCIMQLKSGIKVELKFHFVNLNNSLKGLHCTRWKIDFIFWLDEQISENCNYIAWTRIIFRFLCLYSKLQIKMIYNSKYSNISNL